MNNFSNGQRPTSPMPVGFTQVENLSKLDMRSLLAGGIAARKNGEDCGPALWLCSSVDHYSGISGFLLRCRSLSARKTGSGRKLDTFLTGFGIHFYEQSSAGKTTTANVAASLYGNPDLLRLTWYGTALGLANEAAAHNDALMPLDEVGQGVDPHSVAQSAYALFNGVGKLQGAKDGGNGDRPDGLSQRLPDNGA